MKKLISLLLVALMVLSLTACASKPVEVKPEEQPSATDSPAASPSESEEAAPEESAAPAVDLTEPVQLVFYLMGDPPQDKDLIQDAVNEVLKEKYNTTLDFQFSTWTDFQQKYANELTSGNSDMVYIASWLSYQTLAHSGAFLELDDLLNNYAPQLRARAGEDMLNMCRVGGEVYAVPALWPEYVPTGVSYREDLRAKFDLPVPDSLENLEAYFQGIKDNMPEQPVLRVTAEESTGLDSAFDAFSVFGFKYPSVVSIYGLKSYTDDPDNLVEYWKTQDFIDDCKLMKKWADAGYWSKSALSDSNDPDSYKNGLTTAIVSGQNPNKHITNMNDFAAGHPDWETKYVTYGEKTGAMWPGHATQNGTAIVRGTKYPERCMLVLQELMMNEDLNHLVQCGRKDVDYKLDENGLYLNLNENFKYEAMNSWNLRVNEYKLPQGTDLILNEMFDRYEKIGAKLKYPNVNIGGGFSEDYTEYQAERTAVSNVMRQYLAPLEAGFVDDVEAAVAEFLQKVDEAGLEKCREAYTAQWKAYCAEYNYD